MTLQGLTRSSADVALVYVRVSRLERDDRQKQLELGSDAKLRALSPSTQIEQCRGLPALHGMKIEVFEDLHRSGKNTRRPGLERLRRRVQDPDVAAVAVWSISRLGRSVADLYAMLEEFSAAGVAFVSAKESIDTSTAYGRAFLGVLAVLAQFERELTSERVAANFEQLAREGGLVGPVPTGYRRDPESRAVVIDPGPAEVIRRLFEEYATARHSFRSLAIWANDAGLRPPQQDRGQRGRAGVQLDHFTADSIRDLLSNMRYAGRFVHRRRRNTDGEIVRGQFPAIISWELWSRCAAIRRANRRERFVAGDRGVSPYALTGLLVCGSCGDNVRGDTVHYGHQKSGRRRRYLCRRGAAAQRCREPQANADALEAEIASWLRAVRIRPGWQELYAAEYARAAAGSPAKHSAREQRARAIQAKIERLRVSWEAGARSDELAYRREVAALREELEAVRSTPEPPLARQGRILSSLVDRWDEMSADQRKRVLSTIFRELRMKDGQLEAGVPHPDWLPYLERVTSVPSEGPAGIEPATPALGRRRSIR
jgi:site-specific DNA recombinase